MSKKQKITQAELFGVDELPKVTKDDRGIGTLPSKVPPDPIALPATKSAELSMTEEQKAKARAFMQALSKAFEGVIANHDEGTPVGCSPLPWHWEEGGGGTINVLDANNCTVFSDINGGEVYSDRDWENVELLVACVNKFAESMTEERLDRLRKLQVYGDENYDEGESPETKKEAKNG